MNGNGYEGGINAFLSKGGCRRNLCRCPFPLKSISNQFVERDMTARIEAMLEADQFRREQRINRIDIDPKNLPFKLE
jgi:hypothetical protein